MAKIEVGISSQVNETGKSELLFRISVNRTNRFRIKSGIYVYPERFKSGIIKPQRAEDKEGRRKQMIAADEKLSNLKTLIINSCENDNNISKDELSIIVDRFHNPDKYKADAEQNSLIVEFSDYAERCYKDSVFGADRKKHYAVSCRMLDRFLIINNISNIKPIDFTSDKLILFKDFLLNEYTYVDKYRGLYVGVKDGNLPTKQRSQNTVAAKLKQLQAFFNELESDDRIEISPFRKLGKRTKAIMMREQYDEPIYLTKEEFLMLRSANVSSSLREVRDVFVLQCSLGCRIGDFQALSFDNIGVEDNIPYIHYLPKKTMNEGNIRKEVKTPLMHFSLEIIKKYDFKFSILNYVSGGLGYNNKIKRLLKSCGINRPIAVFESDNGEKGKNEYKPICDVASSKLARKTHVDLMNKVQINKYAAGLHKHGSSAVERYTAMSIKDRFVLMCAAFGDEEYRVDSDLAIVEAGDNR